MVAADRIVLAHLTAMVLVFGSFFAGCGGGSESHVTATTSSSSANAAAKAATEPGFEGNAEAICKRLNSQLAGDNVNSISDIPRIAPRRAALEKATLVELQRLEPPANLKRSWSSMLAARRQIAISLARLGVEVAAGHVNSVQPILSSSGRLETRMTALARHAGFSDCAKIG